MRYKFYYGESPQLTSADRDMFSYGDYCCHRLLQTKSGKPVAVLQNNKGIWMVQYGFSSVYFGDYTEAMVFCRSHFCELDGGPIRK